MGASQVGKTRLMKEFGKQHYKNFFFGQIKKGARSSELEKAIQWLAYSGLFLRVHKFHHANSIRLTLRKYKEQE